MDEWNALRLTRTKRVSRVGEKFENTIEGDYFFKLLENLNKLIYLKQKSNKK